MLRELVLMWHGILVNVAFDKWFLDSLKIIGKKDDGDWIILKIGVPEQAVVKTANAIQSNMKDAFYSHLYSEDGRLIVIFKKRVFEVKADRSAWKPVIEYGKSIGVPEEQLDFFPCRFEDEEY